ncbi:rod shape-determining protein RodA [Flavobacterium flavipallidum]|uniref:Rod shape-determining protein RodA n=1 Tax=Flavobacterium flavipallidum TaxID=3139140 RepID=A0ABU9HM93_9FLAO
MKNQSVKKNIDWICVIIYSSLVIMGWLNIFSSSLSSPEDTYQKQLIFIAFTIPLIFIILAVDGKFYEKYASVIYIIGLLSLAGLFVFGKTIKGQTNWYSFGSFGVQPSEFVKTATALAIAKYMSDSQINLKDTQKQFQVLSILGLPILLIVPHDPGSALIYTIFLIVLYREGLPAWYIWTGFIAITLFIFTLVFEPQYVILMALIAIIIVYWRSRLANRNIIASGIIFALISGFVLSVNYVFENVFKQHHRDRFNILLGKTVDLKGIGYNTNQSEIAIGSGGWFGKGFLEGTQTKGGFVPEQHTDYIFTTVGEEWGFIGSLVVIALFVTLFLRIIFLAERQKTKFSRVYGYCCAGILFIHFFVNIAMVIGIFPTIGVPLPFFSYGGSGLWGFTILLFIFLKMDANKVNEW